MRLPARQTLLIAVDQGLSSLTNFLPALWLLFTVEPAEFGRFALAVTVYQVLLNMARAVASEPLLAVSAGRDPEAVRHEGGIAGGAVVLMTPLISIVGLAFLLVAGESSYLRIQGVVLLAFPALAIADFFRHVGFSARRAEEAVAIDLAWLVVTSSGLGIASSIGAGATGAALCWSLGAVAGAVLGTLFTRPELHPAELRRWFRRNRILARSFLAEFLVERAAFQAGFVLLSVVAGSAALGSLRAVHLLQGATTVVTAALFATASTRGRNADEKDTHLRTLLGLGSLAVVLVSLPVAAVPQSFARRVVDGSVTNFRIMAVLSSLTFAGWAIAAIGRATLRRSGDVSLSRRIRIGTAVAVVVSSGVGVALGGAVGLATAWFAVSVGANVAWLRALGQYGVTRPQPRSSRTDAGR